MNIKFNNEAKTGLFIIVCFLALGVLLLKVGNFTLLQDGYKVRCQLDYSAGVRRHAPVRWSGVDVGEVKDIQIVEEETEIPLVELTLWIQQGVKVRRDATAYVATLGMMGEKYIEIKAGTPSAEYAKDGDLILGDNPVRLEDLLQKAQEVAEDIGQVARDVSKVANHIDETIVDNRSKIDRMIDNFEDTSVNFKDFSQTLKYHPWKVLAKGRELDKDEMDRLDEEAKLRRENPEAYQAAKAKEAEDKKARVARMNFGTRSR